MFAPVTAPLFVVSKMGELDIVKGPVKEMVELTVVKSTPIVEAPLIAIVPVPVVPVVMLPPRETLADPT